MVLLLSWLMRPFYDKLILTEGQSFCQNILCRGFMWASNISFLINNQAKKFWLLLLAVSVLLRLIICCWSKLSTMIHFFLYTSNLQGLTIQQHKIKNSKIHLQNKTQTFRKSYKFLNKVCTRRGHININNNNNNNNIDNNNNNDI